MAHCSYIRTALLLWLLQASSGDCNVSPPEGVVQQSSCTNPGVVLLQQNARIESMTTAEDDVPGSDHLVMLSSGKIPPPSWLMIFSVVAGIGLLCAGISTLLGCKQGRGISCICCGTCGGLFIILAIALVVVKVYMNNLAGPSPAGPAKQTPMTTEVTVDTVIPFTAKDINTPGPVRTVYIEGMQEVLDDRSDTPGAVKVLGVKATSRNARAMLIQDIAGLSANNAVALLFTLSSLQKSEQSLLPELKKDHFNAAVVKAAKRQVGNVPYLLTEIAGGEKTAAAHTTMELSISTSFRCNADHEMTNSIVTAGRVLAKEHLDKLGPEIVKFAQGKLKALGTVKLADRCNLPSQDKAMQICIDDDSLWVDLVAIESNPGHDDSVRSTACSAGCSLAKALSDKTHEVVTVVNKELKEYTGVFEVDSNMVEPFSCVPSLPKGEEKCEPCS